MSRDGTVAGLAERAHATGRLGIDTEFMGEGRYRSMLCLVQVAVEEEDGGARVEVLDPLSGELDPAPLADILADPAVEVVLHAGRQGAALVRLEWAGEGCRALESSSDEREPATVFARLPRVNSLDPAQRAVALALVEWRER